MIDLERRGLPDRLVVEGAEVPVDTSFRTWLRFSRLLGEGLAWPGVFPQGEPEGDWIPAAMEFLRDENPVPHDGPGGPRLDWLADSDWLVGGFLQAYGVDLTTADMHWHLFLALVRSLPTSTRFAEVMGHRGWRRDGRRPDAVREELRRMWSLPEEADEDLVALQRSWFGGVTDARDQGEDSR